MGLVYAILKIVDSKWNVNLGRFYRRAIQVESGKSKPKRDIPHQEHGRLHVHVRMMWCRQPAATPTALTSQRRGTGAGGLAISVF